MKLLDCKYSGEITAGAAAVLGLVQVMPADTPGINFTGGIIFGIVGL